MHTKEDEKKVNGKSDKPRTLVDEMVQDEMHLTPQDEGYETVQRGVTFLFKNLLEIKEPVADQGLVNRLIADIDRRVGYQMDEILHNSQFQKLEASWRGLKLLVDRTNFRENIEIEILNVSKEDLLSDFRETPEITKSGLYNLIYSSEFGMFGGNPFGALIGNYDFDQSAKDVELLQRIASVSTMAHAPFIAAASPKFFGLDSFVGLPNLKDIKATMVGPQYIKWNSFRESEDSRSVGLTLPRFLLRGPYSSETGFVNSFEYTESVSAGHESYLWGNAAFAFATRLTDSFAKYRWCPNIIGPAGGGAVEDLPIHYFEATGMREAKIPTEVLISQRRGFELAEEGFIPLEMRKGSDNACFFSANSCQKPKTFPDTPEGKAAATNYKLGTQLPYTMIVSRLAHYLKVLQREQIGANKSRADLETDLNNWIKQYRADEGALPSVRARKPLVRADVKVSEVEGDPGWYRVDLSVQPAFKYMGAFFTLSLVGRLDRKQPLKG